MAQLLVSMPAFLFLVFVAIAAPAAAQNYRTDRPYRGLFGSGVSSDTQQSLIASGSIGAGWDNDLIADAAGSQSSAGVGRFKGGLGTTTGAIAYALSRQRVSFGASYNTALSYYPDLRDRFVRRDYFSAAAATQVTRDLSVRGGAGYRPYSTSTFYPLLFSPRPGDPTVEDDDLITHPEHYFSYFGGASYAHRMSERGSFTASYDYHARSSSASIGRFNSHTGSARYTHELGRGLSARLGYGYSTGKYTEDPDWYQHHVIDAGIDYNRALSLTRRTAVSFSTGTSVARASGTADTRYFLNASGRLSHDLGRSWAAVASYNRGVQFIESWPEPVFSDAAAVGIGGQLHQRVSFQALARATHGTGRSGVADNSLYALRGTANLGIGISRYVGGSVGYFYDRHDVGAGLLVPATFPRYRDRQGIRLSLTGWVPLYTTRTR